jgi:L-ascorbate metabolism protein UlaG (beta-lactamase superfamily)
MAHNGAPRLVGDASVTLACHSQHRSYIGEVDCRLLFLGQHYEQLLESHDQIVACFESAADPDAQYGALSASERITGLYDVRRDNGSVTLRLRDTVFRTPGSTGELTFVLKVSSRGRTFERPLPIATWRALGALLPLLDGRSSSSDIPRSLARTLEADETPWALDLLAALEADGLVVRTPPRGPIGPASGQQPSVTLLGHTSLLLRSERASVIVDPIVLARDDSVLTRELVQRIEPSALVCSHSHWDHFNVQTLLLFDKSIPVFIPRVVRASAFNPPMASVLRSLGYSDIRELDAWDSATIEDIEIVAAPFFGEQDEPGVEVDHFTYGLRAPGLSVYGGVDCFRDTFGAMEDVLRRVRAEIRPDIAFLPISRMIYSYRTGGVNGFCERLDAKKLDESMQYTAGPEDAARWASILGPKWVVPYATFTFSGWATAALLSEFQRALDREGIAETHFPLRPGDSLSAEDLVSPMRAEARRRIMLAAIRATTVANAIAPRRRARRAVGRIVRAVRASTGL